MTDFPSLVRRYGPPILAYGFLVVALVGTLWLTFGVPQCRPGYDCPSVQDPYYGR